MLPKSAPLLGGREQPAASTAATKMDETGSETSIGVTRLCLSASSNHPPQGVGPTGPFSWCGLRLLIHGHGLGKHFGVRREQAPGCS
jgi:hypothetical protein